MDRAEVEHLYRQYGPSVYRRAWNILRSDQEANEAMQDVFVTVLTKGDSFRRQSSPMTWLYAVTTRLCLNRIRNSRRRAELMAEYAAGLRAEDRPDPELLHVVNNLLHSVPDGEAQAAVYYYFDEMTHAEIAGLMGCSRRKVGDLLERFRARLATREKGS